MSNQSIWFWALVANFAVWALLMWIVLGHPSVQRRSADGFEWRWSAALDAVIARQGEKYDGRSRPHTSGSP